MITSANTIYIDENDKDKHLRYELGWFWVTAYTVWDFSFVYGIQTLGIGAFGPSGVCLCFCFYFFFFMFITCFVSKPFETCVCICQTVVCRFFLSLCFVLSMTNCVVSQRNTNTKGDGVP